MKVAILSGKGGTGKTLLSVNLAASCENSIYVDCDVEEPNGHLFFKPKEIEKEKVSIKIPLVDPKRCTGCRKCVDFCNFNALAYIKDRLFVFEEVCHSCGGCSLFCLENAISEKEKSIGEIQTGISDNTFVMSGILNTGEASGVPIIKRLLQKCNTTDKSIFIDCPPGSACIVMESIKDVDYCVLVAEPTIFGVHNLSMVYDLVKLFNKPHGVVLNKCLEGPNPAEEFCIKNNIPVIGRIPFDEKLGELNSNAFIASRERTPFRGLFYRILENIIKEANNETVINT